MPSTLHSQGQRIVAYAGAAVAITWDGEQTRRIADFLFGHVPAQPAAPPCATMHLRWIAHSRSLGLYRGDVLIYLGDSEGHLAELLMSEVCRLLVTHSGGGLLFHAAGLTWQGGGIMLPAAMTSGKSTLAAWLALQGFSYLTDELVFIPDGAEQAMALIRPLNLRSPSRAALPEAWWQALRPRPWASREGALVPPEALNPQGRWEPPRLGLIVFPRYAPDATPSVRRLSRAEAALALLGCLVNAGRLSDGGVPEVARIARAAPAYAATYSNLEQLVESLDTWRGALAAR